MSTLVYKIYTKDEIKNEIDNRAFPRSLIVLKNPNGFDYILKQAIRTLNKYTAQTRYYEIYKSSDGHISTSPSNMPNLHGININSVSGVYAANEQQAFYEIWRNFRVAPNFFNNLYRFQNNFQEYTAAEILYKQIQKKWNNRNTGWQYLPTENKILLNSNVWYNINKFMIEFVPEFDINSDEFEMFDIEFQFLVDLTYAELLHREAIAKSESVSMGVETNYQLLLDEAKELKEKTIEEWNKSVIYKSAKRF